MHERGMLRDRPRLRPARLKPDGGMVEWWCVARRGKAWQRVVRRGVNPSFTDLLRRHYDTAVAYILRDERREPCIPRHLSSIKNVAHQNLAGQVWRDRIARQLSCSPPLASTRHSADAGAARHKTGGQKRARDEEPCQAVESHGRQEGRQRALESSMTLNGF